MVSARVGLWGLGISPRRQGAGGTSLTGIEGGAASPSMASPSPCSAAGRTFGGWWGFDSLFRNEKERRRGGAFFSFSFFFFFLGLMCVRVWECKEGERTEERVHGHGDVAVGGLQEELGLVLGAPGDATDLGNLFVHDDGVACSCRRGCDVLLRSDFFLSLFFFHKRAHKKPGYRLTRDEEALRDVERECFGCVWFDAHPRVLLHDSPLRGGVVVWVF